MGTGLRPAGTAFLAVSREVNVRVRIMSLVLPRLVVAACMLLFHREGAGRFCKNLTRISACVLYFSLTMKSQGP